MKAASHFNFQPDLIIETTAVCDRSCAGCYAPNMNTKAPASQLLQSNPEFFLNPDVLTNALQQIMSKGEKISVLALRGGEPTRHPLICQIIRAAAVFSEQAFLETHGRWVIEADKTELAASIISCCQESAVTIKISFDPMHGLSPTQLMGITDTLSRNNVSWVIAITESTEERFQNVRSTCPEIPSDKIIFQKMAVSANELIRPRLGVISKNGVLSSGLSTRRSFVEASPINHAPILEGATVA